MNTIPLTSMATTLGIICIIPLFLRFIVLPCLDLLINRALNKGPYTVPDTVSTLHKEAFVADLHSDALLSGRDLRKESRGGHVDIPRLERGSVDLQVFGVVTKVPLSLSYKKNSGNFDILPLVFIASWRKPATWFSPRQRALQQANELKKLADTSALTLVLNSNDLSVPGPKGLLSLEGMHALNDGKKSLRELYHAGFRMMGLAHGFDNQIAGSAHGLVKYGLTALGRSLIPEMENLGITIDLTHASEKAFMETLTIAEKAVVVSHGGVQGDGTTPCNPLRNLSDKQLLSIKKNKGIVGIGYSEKFLCHSGVTEIVNAIQYVIKVAGIKHVALGSDFDGTITAPFDTAGLALITESLHANGISEDDIKKILGGNVMDLLTKNLPDKDPA